VRHGYFTVNGQRADIPSMELKPGSKVELRQRFQKHPLLLEVLETTQHRGVPAHLRKSSPAGGFDVVSAPEDVATPIPIDATKVIELHA
jgi:small subunit ribosomal protein S4